MSEPWLSVVGIGADGLAGLGARSRALVEAAEVLVGGRRHLAMMPEDGRPRIPWRSPLEATLTDIRACCPKRTVVLATGDPLWFGIGRLLRERMPGTPIRLEPHVSAFQLACARLGWPLEEVVTASVHGRPLDALRRHLFPGARLLVLTEDGDGPARIGALLVEAGLGDARLWVMEELAATTERIVEATAAELAGQRFASLNLVAVELPARAFPEPWPARTPGLADALFHHDGQLTKAEVRAVTLASLAPQDGELLWDVGAGAGSIAIEWLRAGRAMRAVAVERHAGRVARIRENASRLGVPELAVVEGTAPACLEGLQQPHAVFLGGGVGEPGMLEACFAALAAGGRLVANAVTIAGEAALLAFHARHGGRLVRVAVSRAETVGGVVAWRALAPVTQLVVVKSCDVAS